jgi:hypothetical protein
MHTILFFNRYKLITKVEAGATVVVAAPAPLKCTVPYSKPSDARRIFKRGL